MKLEAVTVCVNYTDFLAHTLPRNRALFDRLISKLDRVHHIFRFSSLCLPYARCPILNGTGC